MKTDYRAYHSEWENLYESGWSGPQIGKKYGCGHRVVLRYLRSRGLTRTVSEARSLQSGITNDVETLIQLYGDGYTLDEISAMSGHKRSALYYLLAKRGLMRSASSALIARARKRQQNAEFFDSIDTEDKAYWFGFVCADGCVQRDKRGFRLSLELSVVDEAHLATFAALFAAPIAKRYRTQKSGKISEMVSCRVASTHLCQSLFSKGVIPVKSLSPTLGTVVDHVPVPLLHHFIRGYFDGDGSATRGGRGMLTVMFSGNASLLARMRLALISSCDVFPAKLSTPRSCREGFATLTWQGRRDVAEIGRWMYQDATVYLERKRRYFAT